MKPLLLILALAFPIYAQSDLKAQIKTFKNNKRFTATYDRFKDQTIVNAGPFYVRGLSLEMSAMFYFKGEQPLQINTLFLVFDSSSTDWQFLHSQHLYAIVDQERIELGEGERIGKVNAGYGRFIRTTVRERLIYKVPIEVFQALSQGKVVELKVGRFEVELKDEHMQAFRDLLSLARRS